MASDDYYGAISNYGSPIQLPPNRVSHRGKAMTMDPAISSYLAKHDIKRNPRLATYAGAKRYADKNPQRRKAEVRDINNDGIPDILLYYDKDGNQRFDPNEVTHVNGYYPRKTDWGYRSRYWADREQFPDTFKDDRIGMGQYVEAMHKGFNRDSYGKVKFDNDPTRDAFEANIKKHGGIIKRPHNLSSMQLWKKHIFDPVYYAFTAKGILQPDHTGKQKKLALEPDFRYIVVSGKCYKDLISGPALAAATGMDAPPQQEEALREYNKIKNSKQFREQLAGIVRRHLENFVPAWNEVYNYLEYVECEDPQLYQTYGDIQLTTAEIQAAYDARYTDESTMATKRNRDYPSLTRARNLAHDNNFDTNWRWEKPNVERHTWWTDAYDPRTAKEWATKYDYLRGEPRDRLHSYYALLEDLQQRQDQAINDGDRATAVKVEGQLQQVQNQIDDLLTKSVFAAGPRPSLERVDQPPPPAPARGSLIDDGGTGYYIIWKGTHILHENKLPEIGQLKRWIPEGTNLTAHFIKTGILKKTGTGNLMNLTSDNWKYIANIFSRETEDPLAKIIYGTTDINGQNMFWHGYNTDGSLNVDVNEVQDFVTAVYRVNQALAGDRSGRV